MDAKLRHHSHWAWVRYGELIRDGTREGFHDEFDIWNERYATYAQFGIVMGGFSREIASRLLRALDRSQPEPVLDDGAIPQFIGTELPEAEIEAINRQAEFLKPSAEALWWLSDIVDDLATPIASFMGSPWRVLCVRSWRMRTGPETVGPNLWHRDGMPFPIVKLMIYPHPIDRQRGTIEIRFPNGQTLTIEQDGPCWVLFKSSEVEHRGVPPLLDEMIRYTVELTVVPSPRFDLVPTFAGNNARHPLYPWLRGSYHGL